ncbi:hypothetical protein MSP8887_00633 [Marinomonas spartinae]|uniref:DnaT DNA-binding domain-containing protein n=1 Tax=Marinomonas spartinae TaxID=1792290 RepID=A0A1A8TBA0_9GAMM|nr:DnaT-like ssDNA-binding domain-containing protein [Marinomonas spartinae]SBS27382.1 hypothetical protein MSP8887_00633 [Marinomonas spartinae]SBS28849.1 hypothetical protein MSP8886_01334 [Marinomonas spartinae]
MLNNDYSLPISFSLAAQIGLEETVLLTFLRQQAYMFNAPALRMEISHLNRQLPFWTVPILMRLLNNLQMSQLLHFKQQEQILEIQLTAKSAAISSTMDSSGTATSDSVKNGSASGVQSDDRLMEKMNRLHQASREKVTSDYSTGASMNPSGGHSPRSHFTPKQQTTSYPARSASRDPNARSQPPVVNDRRGVTDFDLYLEQKERARQPDQWQPEEATLEQIAQSGISREFALSLQAEFLLRIKEQRKNVRTWNSEFFKYVKRQWQYKQSDRSSYEGTSSSSKFSKTSREQVSDALSNIHDTDW